MYKFGKEKDVMQLIRRRYVFSDMPAIEAWDSNGPYAVVTQVVDEIDIDEDEIILNHDVLFNEEFTNAFIEYIGVSKRPVIFGPFGTRTYVVKLKENWKELCSDPAVDCGWM